MRDWPPRLYGRLALTETRPTGLYTLSLHDALPICPHLGRCRRSSSRCGYRTLTPYLQGFGPTRFLEKTAFRSGRLAALGQDLIEFADAVGVERFMLVGHDWGARAAYVVAASAGATARARC